VLAQFGDLEIGPLSRSEKVRARQRAERAGSFRPSELARRARLHRLRGPRGSLERVAGDQRVVVSGARVIRGLVVDDLVEGYVTDVDLASLVDEFALRPVGSDRAQVLLRAPTIHWPFGDRTVAPLAVAAVDLLDANESRSIDAGRQVLAHLAEQLLSTDGRAR
jgi:hypothetical protein